jgi:zinc/manganese transport system permease protein
MPLLASTISSGVPFSANPIDDLQILFQFEFMRNAYIAGTAAAVAAGIVGYFVVLRSLSFASHTLTQIGFAGATGALAASLNPLFGLLLINGLAAAVIGVLGRRESGRDVVTGIVLTTALGLGLLFLSLSRGQAAVPVLVGDVLGISAAQALITVIAAIAILAVLACSYRPLLFAALDEELAEARGVRVVALSVLLLAVLAVTTSVATPIVGVLLTFALLVGPAATAALLSPRPARATMLSVALSLGYMWIGLAVSYWIDFPPSVFVTALAFIGYLVARAMHVSSHSRLSFTAAAPPV